MGSSRPRLQAGSLWSPAGTDTFAIERGLMAQGYHLVAGLDEVGRGPLAGPVVAACVVLPAGGDPSPYLDSKKLSATARNRLFERLMTSGALIGHAEVDHAAIDRLNILQASLLAMKLAAEKLARLPDYLLVDGTFPVPLALPQQTLVKGESRSASIAAASIVAKVLRDQLMDRFHQQFPEYNFQQHKGYPTRAHREAIARCGPCPIHRRSFRGVREFVTGHGDGP